MIVREIVGEEIEPTFVNLKKIYKEQDKEPEEVQDLLEADDLNKAVRDNKVKLYSAFENGGEIGTAVIKDGQIIVLAVKNYAKKRGVASTLLEEIIKHWPKEETLRIETPSDHVDFYKRLGFKELRQPTSDGLVALELKN